ncbi:MAG: flavodoxin family protein [Bacillota bacterium]
MKILAINGSHRKGQYTAQMLLMVLQAAAAQDVETELINVVDYRIKPCSSCHHCLRDVQCSITDDDMQVLADKMMCADGIVIGSPSYFSNVTGLLKVFMDRTRWMHMSRPLLAGKVGASVSVSGLRHGGQEMVIQILDRFLLNHELYLARGMAPPGDGKRMITTSAAIGTPYRDQREGRFVWYKEMAEDPLATKGCENLGLNMVDMIRKLQRIHGEM